MITRKDFIEKLSEWLSYETCDALAFEAEQRFAETDDMSVYELMLVRIASGDTADFIDMCDECDIKLNADDDIDGMYVDMVDEWRQLLLHRLFPHKPEPGGQSRQIRECSQVERPGNLTPYNAGSNPAVPTKPTSLLLCFTALKKRKKQGSARKPEDLPYDTWSWHPYNALIRQ